MDNTFSLYWISSSSNRNRLQVGQIIVLKISYIVIIKKLRVKNRTEQGVIVSM